MKEIEIKIKISDINDLQKKIDDLGIILGPEKIQEDKIYIPSDLEFEDRKADTRILRIRNSNGKYTVTLKYGKVGERELNKIERESEISNPEDMHNMILDLGFKVFMELKKVRRTARYKNFEICLDSVSNLGDFIELETLVTDEEDPVSAIETMWEFAESKLNLDRSMEAHSGYDVLLYQKLKDHSLS